MKVLDQGKVTSPGAGLNQFFRRYWAWLLIVALALLGLGGWYIYTNYLRPQEEVAAEAPLQTAVARTGDLTVFASGAGEIIATQEIGIGFDEAGELSELLISVGDKVQAGQVLARLQTDRTDDEVALAVAQAQLNVLNTQASLDDIYESHQMDAAEALIAVEEAQQALDDLMDTDLQIAQALEAIAEAEDDVHTAQSVYNGVRSTASQTTIDAANAELVLAEKRLKDQKEKFNDYAGKPDNDLEKASQQLKLSDAQSAYDSALRYYNAVTGTGSAVDLALSEAELASAQATLAEAKREYERIKDGPSQGEIALAEATLAVAQAKYDKLKDGPDTSEIALAEAELANAQAELAVAKEQQAVIDLVAPMDATVMSIDASLGEEIGTGAIISLADLTQPVLQVYLDEEDLDKVVIGYEAEVVFDSLPDITYTGHVIEVNPSLQSVSNVDAVAAKVQLDAESFSKPLSLPVGSNASVDVIGGRAQNAVLVPVEAIREIAPGEYAVFVMQDGEPRLRVVTVGLMDYTSAEILTGLQAGEVVTTGLVDTN